MVMESANSCGWLQATKLMVWILLLSSCFTSTNQEEIIEACHLKTKAVWYNKKFCASKSVLIKYCEGQCRSQAGPSVDGNTVTNPNQRITSVAQCCKITNSTNKQISLNCRDEIKTYQLSEPTSCECFHCVHY